MKNIENRNNKGRRKKGLVHTDYVIAIGIFIAIFGLVVLYINNSLSSFQTISALSTLNARAFALISVADFNYTPAGWPELPLEEGQILLLHLSANASSPGGVNDSSGLGNNFTVSGASFNISGRFLGAYGFDGIDDYMNLSDGAASKFDITQVTIEAWVYPASTSGTQMILSKDNGNGAYFLALSGGKVLFTFFNATARYDNTGTTTLPANAFTHVAATYNGTHSVTYVNGTAEFTNTTTGINININNDELQIGARQQAASRSFFNGTVDEVAVYNRTLPANDILNHSQPERRIERIGLRSRIYKIQVGVNNTAANYINQSLSVSNLPDERVSINLSNILSQFSSYSVNVYDERNNTVAYGRSVNNITFLANVSANSIAWFTVYVDDDGVFADRTVSIAGTDNLTEEVLAAEPLSVLSHSALRALNESNYTLLRNATFGNETEGSFRLILRDQNASADYMRFGADAPRRGNIVALQRYFLFQNVTGGIKPGLLTVRVW